MSSEKRFTFIVALIVALGGFLMGFDASVISGVVKFIEPEFQLTKLQLGFSVSSLAFAATAAMLISGPLSDRIGRRHVLRYSAVLFAISAVGSAIAPDFVTLVIARMIGGIGVGASLILAPMYIAEIAPPKMRGQMVSFNQLNIVIGISVAFFTNYLILNLGESTESWAISMKFDEYNWRWMLGLEAIPAILYFFGLFLVPESPRWMVMKGRNDQALQIMSQFTDEEDAKSQIENTRKSLEQESQQEKAGLGELLKSSYQLVLLIGIMVAILQQITGINAVFFYAPMIFEQSGIGTNASFMQAILVGLTNLVFTVLAIMFIDRLGRKPLLVGGLAGIFICMMVLSYGFGSATYRIQESSLANIPDGLEQSRIASMIGVTYDDDISFKNALKETLGEADALTYESGLITVAIDMNPKLILFGIIGFVASFAISLGPVMWVLFSELFPIRIKGIAISFVGFVNSMVSTAVQQFFPWELATLGNSLTFLIYGVFAIIGLVFVIMKVPETKGKSLEELEKQLVKN